MAGLLSTAGLFVVVLSAFVGYIYLYGLPSATKRQIEDAAVNAMGENKNTDMIKDALRKIPDSDHSNLGDVKDNVNSGATGEHQTPLGDTAREIADRATAPGKVREAATGPVVI